jgi:transcription initiation factor IIF auxiliary subunit
MARKLVFALLALSLPALSFAQSTLTAENAARSLGDNRWEWTVFIKGDPKTLSEIRCVQYELHPSFPNRIRQVCDRGPDPNQSFPLTANGWGVFQIPVTITFKDGHVEKLSHYLHFENAAPTPMPTPTRSRSSSHSKRISAPRNIKPPVAAASPTPSTGK